MSKCFSLLSCMLVAICFSSVSLTGCGPDNGTTVMEPTDELRDLYEADAEALRKRLEAEDPNAVTGNELPE